MWVVDLIGCMIFQLYLPKVKLIAEEIIVRLQYLMEIILINSDICRTAFIDLDSLNDINTRRVVSSSKAASAICTCSGPAIKAEGAQFKLVCCRWQLCRFKATTSAAAFKNLLAISSQTLCL